MSFLMGGGQSVKPAYTGLQVQTSTSALCIPMCWGHNRAAPNIIDQDDFQSHKQKQGGKGGGGKGGGSYTYSGTFLLAHGWGQMTGIGAVYKDQSVTTLSALGMTFFSGATPQAPWGYMTANHPSKALGYAGIAYSAVANYDLGGSNTIAQHSFELQALRYNSASWTGGGDADMALILQDYLSDPTMGVGFDSGFIDQTTLYSTTAATTTGDNALQTYCRANGWGFSPVLVNQTAASDTLNRWADLCNTALIWTGYSLKFMPWSAETITANGVTYLPNFPLTYILTDADFIGDGSTDPITFERADPRDCKNIVSITINNRANQYNPLPVMWHDNTLIDQFGANPESSVDASEICSVTMAQQVVALLGQRNAYVRNRFHVKLGQNFVRIEPGDIIQIVDAGLGSPYAMVEEVTENEDDTFDIVAFQWDDAVTHVPTINTASASGTNVNTGVAAAAVNPPVIFEPPSTLAGAPQIWAAVSGGAAGVADPLWGGCNVWISTDNTTYTQIGVIEKPARQGVLTASLANYGGANPDTGHTLSVSTAMSNGELDSASSGADAAAGSTLCYVDGEFIGPQTATLTGTNAYNLTTLYRGLYGSAMASHASGTKFARLDDAIFKYALPAAYIGTTLYLKFQSFNVYGGGYQDLSACTAYTFTPTGTGFGGGTAGAPTVPTGLSASAGYAQVALSWSANPVADNVTAYKVFRAAGTGASFGSASLIATVTGLTYTNSSLPASTGYTYFIEAVNAIGASAATSGVNATTSATGFGSANLVFNELPSGTINGSNTSFSLAHAPTAGVQLYLNGVLQQPGSGKDYTLSGATITMTVAPSTGDILLASYQY